MEINGWRNRFKLRFKHLKTTTGLTQEELAEKVGVSQGTIAHWVNGRRSPDDLQTYEKLAKALKMHPAELLYAIDPDAVKSWDQNARLLKKLKQLTDDKRQIVEATIDAFSDDQRVA